MTNLSNKRPILHFSGTLLLACVCASSLAIAADQAATRTGATGNASPAVPAAPVLAPADYIIGADDVLAVRVWKEPDLSAEVVVRPDGKISLPMLNDVQAAGLKPEQLAEVVEKAAQKYVRDPQATVMVKEIHSRKITIIGQVAKSGSFALSTGMTVLQAIGEAGGFTEDANKSDITVVRLENGVERRYKFNYNEVVKGTKTQQNIRLLPGDAILVR
jgi:polysaccharide biosynthesis/export protein